MNSENNTLLSIKGLKTQFNLKEGKVLRAVDGIDLDIKPGEIHGLVGESGCGKTIASLSILRLIDHPGKISAGEILCNGHNLLNLSEKDMEKIRGEEIALIFQNASSALNPVYTIGRQIIDVIKLHKTISKKDAENEAIRLLRVVKLPDPEKRINDYPHQLSGGMCQRVMIAMALSCQPKLLIADEPTAFLDVTIQAQIMDLLLELRDQFNMAMLLISHDMGVVARMCDRISVMYLGKIVEESKAEILYASPKHPYTQALLKAVPIPDPTKKSGFSLLKGDLPGSIDIPSGCRFRTRCPEAFDRCSQEEPLLESINTNGTKAACWLYDTIVNTETKKIGGIS
jgi:oligopeptide/dipeptide ABC transporter ATP-binding protein